MKKTAKPCNSPHTITTVRRTDNIPLICTGAGPIHPVHSQLMSLATEAMPETRLHFCHFPAVHIIYIYDMRYHIYTCTCSNNGRFNSDCISVGNCAGSLRVLRFGNIDSIALLRSNVHKYLEVFWLLDGVADNARELRSCSLSSLLVIDASSSASLKKECTILLAWYFRFS